MAKLKALSMIQCREYVLEHHGKAGIDRVKERMSSAARDVVYSPLLVATDWVDVEFGVEHARAYDRAFPGAREWTSAERMITELVAKHYQGLYRAVFATVDSPLTVLEKSSRLWPRFYDAGETTVEVHGETHVTKRIVGCPDLPKDHDRLTTPYYEELVRQAGARNVHSLHTQCVARGDTCCATVIRWEQ